YPVVHVPDRILKFVLEPIHRLFKAPAEIARSGRGICAHSSSPSADRLTEIRLPPPQSAIPQRRRQPNGGSHVPHASTIQPGSPEASFLRLSNRGFSAMERQNLQRERRKAH